MAHSKFDNEQASPEHDVSEYAGDMILGAIEKERSRIAMALHDGLGQELTSSLIVAQQLLDTVGSSDPVAHELANRLIEIQSRIAESARHLIDSLQPQDVLSSGLRNALKALSASIDSLPGEIASSVASSSEPFAIMPAEARLHLYRIAQEAANNALKHSRCTQIDFSLLESDGLITLSIAEDGKGLDVPVGQQGHHGLANMSRRAEMIGGELTIGPSKPDGTGTVVSCSVLRTGLDALSANRASEAGLSNTDDK